MGGKRKFPQQLTPLELQIMNVLWDCGPSNVQSVQEKLAGSPKLAYTTVQTMLNVLYRKAEIRQEIAGQGVRLCSSVDQREGSKQRNRGHDGSPLWRFGGRSPHEPRQERTT